MAMGKRVIPFPFLKSEICDLQSNVAWMVMQSHRPKENPGVVTAFRRDQSACPACEGRLVGQG